MGVDIFYRVCVFGHPVTSNKYGEHVVVFGGFVCAAIWRRLCRLMADSMWSQSRSQSRCRFGSDSEQIRSAIRQALTRRRSNLDTHSAGTHSTCTHSAHVKHMHPLGKHPLRIQGKPMHRPRFFGLHLAGLTRVCQVFRTVIYRPCWDRFHPPRSLRTRHGRGDANSDTWDRDTNMIRERRH